MPFGRASCNPELSVVRGRRAGAKRKRFARANDGRAEVRGAEFRFYRAVLLATRVTPLSPQQLRLGSPYPVRGAHGLREHERRERRRPCRVSGVRALGAHLATPSRFFVDSLNTR